MKKEFDKIVRTRRSVRNKNRWYKRVKQGDNAKTWRENKGVNE